MLTVNDKLVYVVCVGSRPADVLAVYGSSFNIDKTIGVQIIVEERVKLTNNHVFVILKNDTKEKVIGVYKDYHTAKTIVANHAEECYFKKFEVHGSITVKNFILK